MEATLKDIAIATGFSINTVSRSLRDDRAISVKTRNLIKEKAVKGQKNNKDLSK